MVDQAEILEHDTDAASQRVVRLAVGEQGVGIEQRNDAARRRFGQIDDFQQRRLARPADAGQKIKAASVELHRDVMQDFRIGAVALADVLQSDHARLRDPRSPAPPIPQDACDL